VPNLLFLDEWWERWWSSWGWESPIIEITVCVLTKSKIEKRSTDFLQTSIAEAEKENEVFALANVSDNQLETRSGGGVGSGRDSSPENEGNN
jgi:hypothetical protein